MQARLLFVGDIHLGRGPSRLSDELLSHFGLERRALGPAEALRRSVERAIAERVDAVLFAGDLVEDESDFYEAYPRLREAVERLVEAGITPIAVAGNHDVEVLPRLAREIRELALLGAGGRWEARLVRREGRPIARVVGWSFPERVVRTSPLESFPAAWSAGRYDDEAPSTLPTIGLLHADLDSGDRRYAPVRRAELEARPLAAWILGHVHAPSHAGLAAARPIGYLGSLCGLAPDEPGPHGPWLGTLDAEGLRLELLPLAPMRWEELRLTLDGVESLDQLDSALLAALEARHAELEPQLGGAALIGLRLVLEGERAIGARELERHLADPKGPLSLRQALDSRRYFLEAAQDRSRPRLALAELVRGSDPAALFARRLATLEQGGEECAKLLREARAALASSADLRHPAARADELTDEELRELCIEVARAGLEELLAQRQPLAELFEREREESPA